MENVAGENTRQFSDWEEKASQAIIFASAKSSSG